MERLGVKRFPQLFGLDSKGRTKVWSIRVVSHYKTGEIVTEYGLEGGTMQYATDAVTEGKNLGKRNMTTPYEQACLEAESKWNKQLDKGYVTDPQLLAEVAELPRAMLAHPYEKRSHNISWPALVQPKLDGIRLISHVEADGVKFYSRNGKPISTVDHLAPALQAAFPAGTVVDGELFNPDMTLQDIVSGAKRLSEKSARLQYWIYDLVNNMPAAHRQRAITQALGIPGLVHPPITDCLVRVRTSDCLDEEDMFRAYRDFLNEGFEGAIVRNHDGLYKRGKRSADLQKVKPTEDAEFRIIGFKEGRGKFRGHVIWECETDKCVLAHGVVVSRPGLTFEAVPKGSMPERAEWYRNGHDFIGKMLTVEFAGYTPAGIPFHTRGLVIRDYE